MAKKKRKVSPNTIGINKQARRNYEFVETFEAGISLTGPEVKSLREGRVSFKDGHVRFRRGEAWLVGVHISPYENTNAHDRDDPERPRKLLLHKQEIEHVKARKDQRGLTVIPTKMYFARGKVKVEIALARGKKTHDKREDLKRKDIERDTARQLAGYK